MPPPTQQKLLGLDVTSLKSLKDVSLDFSNSALTAIMGSNCSGKTTVLHALACAHQPLTPDGLDYQFPLFFRPNTDALWKDSDFTIRYAQRVGANEFPSLSQKYSKATDRWTPRYPSRPFRYVRFVNIGESVPDIETMKLKSMIHYRRTENNEALGIQIRETAGQVLNRQYESFYNVRYNYLGKESIGVKTATATYSGLSMSSGEQRVFRILDAVFRAPNYGLILVDEIDLFLHQDALQRLLSKLQDHCIEKHKQLVFTTHFPPIAKMYDKMVIYTLNRIPAKTVVWRGYSYEAMRHITGEQERPISCYVEDDVAEQIVSHIAIEMGLRKFLQFGTYGPAVNAFSLCWGLYLSEPEISDTIAILDGDVYGAKSERKARVEALVTGNQPIHDVQRKALMRLVWKLSPTKNGQGQFRSPEQMLNNMLHGLDANLIPAERSELHGIALGVVNVIEKHGFVNKIIEHTGESRDIALSKIVELASLSTDWKRYTRPIRHWLSKKKTEMHL